MTLSLFLILLLALLLEVPVAFALVAASLGFLYLQGFDPYAVVTRKMMSGVDSFPLLALPFYILAGDLMAYGVTPRLMRIARALVGPIQGGLAIAGVAASAFFGAISGSGVATTAAIGGVVAPEMIRDGYSKGFTTSLFAGAGTLGFIIPPSLPMVIYGVSGSVSIGELFIAGVIPGCLLAGILVAYCRWAATKYAYPVPQTSRSMEELLAACRDGALPALMPLLILGGILSGAFTATEAGVVAVVYAFFLTFFVYRELKLKSLFAVLRRSAGTTSVILLIISAATPFAWAMAMEEIPSKLVELFANVTDSKNGILLFVAGLLLLLGTFMEASAIIIITTPILLPLVTSVGVDSVHYGIILMVALAVGSTTPPLAVTLFVATRITKITVADCYPYIWHIVGLLTLGLTLTIWLPELTLALPRWLFH